MSGEPNPTRSDEQWIQDYLGGRLSEAQAEAFETRCLADDELGAELERALEIRAALAPRAANQRVTEMPATIEPAARRRDRLHRRRQPQRVPVMTLAVAAAAAVLVAGLYFLRPTLAPEPVFRGAEQLMGLEVEVSGNQMRARWTPVSGAKGYEIRVFDHDGQPIDATQVDTASATIDFVSSVKPAAIDVVALDDFGQTLIRSQRITLPDPNGSR